MQTDPQMTPPIPAADDLFCLSCGYELRGIDSERCPECGRAIDRTQGSSRIPWLHRRRLGRVRAYWRTTRLALSPARLSEEMGHPVDLKQAKRFRLVTVMLAFLPLLALIGVCYGLMTWPRRPLQARVAGPLGPIVTSVAPASGAGLLAEIACLLSVAIAVWLLLMAIAGIPSYFFDPPELPVARQDRAIVLSYYTCAPLACLGLPVAFFIAWILIRVSSGASTGVRARVLVMLLVLCGASLIGLTLLRWSLAVLLLRRTTHCRTGRAVAMVLVLPLAEIALAVAVALIPLGVLLIAVMMLSLRGEP